MGLVLGCSSRSVSLEGRSCSTSLDCVSGYSCIAQTCVIVGDGPGEPPELIDSLTLGATFIVDPGTSATDFPVYVALDATRLEHEKVASGGANIRFIDVAARQFVPYEIVRLDATGVTTMWLQFASINGPTRVQIGYGDAALAAPTDNGWASTAFAGVWHFDSGADSSGMASSLTTSSAPTEGQYGSAFTPAANEVASATRNQLSTTATLELVVRPQADSWTLKRTMTTDATPIDALQVSWTLPRATSRKVVGPANNALPVWTERSSPSTQFVWVRVPTQGTTTLVTYEGPEGARPEAGIREVCNSGAWATLWSSTAAAPANQSEMNGRFTSLTYASAAYAFRQNASIHGTGDCATHSSNCNFATLFEAWLVVPAGTYYFGTSSDDASDVMLGGTGWKNGDGAPRFVVSSYGQHPADNPARVSSAIVLTGEPIRYQYRHTQGGGGWQIAGLIGTSNVLTAPANAVPANQLWSRRRVTPEPATTVGAQVYLGEIVRDADDLTVTAGPEALRVAIGDAVLDGGPVSTWAQITVVVDGGFATLYRDGVQTDIQPMSVPISTGSRTLSVGDGSRDPQSQAVVIDELRYSTIARSASWIAAQAGNVGGELVTFE